MLCGQGRKKRIATPTLVWLLSKNHLDSLAQIWGQEGGGKVAVDNSQRAKSEDNLAKGMKGGNELQRRVKSKDTRGMEGGNKLKPQPQMHSQLQPQPQPLS